MRLSRLVFAHLMPVNRKTLGRRSSCRTGAEKKRRFRGHKTHRRPTAARQSGRTVEGYNSNGTVKLRLQYEAALNRCRCTLSRRFFCATFAHLAVSKCRFPASPPSAIPQMRFHCYTHAHTHTLARAERVACRLFNLQACLCHFIHTAIHAVLDSFSNARTIKSSKSFSSFHSRSTARARLYVCLCA